MAAPEIPVPPPVSLPAQTRSGYDVVPLPEEIDLLNAAAVQASLVTALAPGACWVVADMTRTRFCDAAGCRALASGCDRAGRLGIRFWLVAPHPSVRKVFQLTGVDQLTEVCAAFGGIPAHDADRRPANVTRPTDREGQ
jgi:anti-sigma B factor antagonist